MIGVPGLHPPDDRHYGNADGIVRVAETGFGAIGMLINVTVTITVSQLTTKPPLGQRLVAQTRYPAARRWWPRTRRVASRTS